MLSGIDVSRYQGQINWNLVKTDFVLIRAGYGKNTLDPQFIRNITECNRLNIPCGVYWFSYALSEQDAANEARRCLEAVRPYRLEYPVCFDFEYDSVRYAQQNGITITRRMATDFVKSFCDTVEQAKYYAMYYANEDYLNNMFYPQELTAYDLWYARYRPGTDPGREGVGIWQHTEQGVVVGIDGNVDLNYAFKDYPKIIRAAGLNHLMDRQADTAVKAFQELVYPKPDGVWNDLTAQLAGENQIRQGSRGDLVKLAQERLIHYGFPLNVSGADGIFGTETDRQIRAFQADRGLTRDGVVGTATWKALLGA